MRDASWPQVPGLLPPSLGLQAHTTMSCVLVALTMGARDPAQIPIMGNRHFTFRAISIAPGLWQLFLPAEWAYTLWVCARLAGGP